MEATPISGDTNRRAALLKEKGLHYLGVGISGGEEGARFGPSIMPGGSREAYEAVGQILQTIAAKADNTPAVPISVLTAPGIT